jgi:hypothetical protein
VRGATTLEAIPADAIAAHQPYSAVRANALHVCIDATKRVLHTSVRLCEDAAMRKFLLRHAVD